jgi:RNA polymerase subunit RPABC4/transcription elongation factor Spt4
VLCSKCGANLPDGSHSCPACGAPEAATADGPTLEVATEPACSKCGTGLPEGSQFCLKCGQPVPAAALANQLATVPPAPAPERVQLARRRSGPPVVLIGLVLVLAGLLAWIAFSDNPTAQELREDVTGARTRTIIETPFSVKPHSYSYYDFTVPPGAMDVTVTGDFTAVSSQEKSKDKDKFTDNNVEVYLLTDTAFVAWRDGYSTGSFYESGRTASDNIGAKLPSGAGHYYLVFSNNFSPRAPKTVRGTVLLHYRALLSESLGQVREKIGNWLGFN